MILGKAIILIGVALGLLAGFFFPGGILIAGMLALYVAGLGGLVWAAGWIV